MAPHRLRVLVYNYREKNLANRGVSSQTSVNSCAIRAAFGLFLTNSGSILAVFLRMLLHIVVNSAQYCGDSGRIQPNPA